MPVRDNMRMAKSEEKQQKVKEDMILQFWELCWSDDEDTSSSSSSSECSLSSSEPSSESLCFLSPIASFPTCSSISLNSSLLKMKISEGDEGAGIPSVPSKAQSASTSVPSLCVGGEPTEMPPQGESPPTPAEGPGSLQGAAAPEPCSPELLSTPVAEMVGFMLLKFVIMEVITEAELLSIICPHDHDVFAVTFAQACECLQLVFGVGVQELDPQDHAYVLVTIVGFKLTEGVHCEGGLPQSALLLLILGFIMQEGGYASEEVIWGALNTLRLHPGERHDIFGDPAELLTKLWVQKQYLELRQVLDSDPTRYMFCWGPRAHAESSKSKVLELWLAVGSRGHKSCPCPADTEQERS